MPSRYLSLFILAFWLGTTSWLFYREVGPRLWPGAPPPYRIDLTDEAQSNIQTQWSILQEVKDNDYSYKGYCKTSVTYHPEDDTFELWGQFKYWPGGKGATEADQIIESSYFVTREGELRRLNARLIATISSPLNVEALHVEGSINGSVSKGYFTPEVTLLEPLAHKQSLKPIRVAEGGSVLNPLQPLHRLPGLRKGQRWQIPLIDPLSDLAHKYIKEIMGASPLSEVRILQAQVLPHTQILVYGNPTQEIPCLVIDYQGEDTTARTWVRETDGLVLMQELTQGKTRMVLVRD